MKPWWLRAARALARPLALLLVSLLALQVYFAARVVLMVVVDPASTTFERSEAWRLLTEKHEVRWSQEWVAASQMGDHIKRAVIASEDAGFTDHTGVEWDALERAWERNQAAQARADRLNEARQKRASARPELPARQASARLVGGSTITQQLAKNLFLSGERSLARKGQEFAITLMLEGFLGKARILEIYLNHVEWGEGVFGVEAAAQHYFRGPAKALSSLQAAQLAVLLPAPKRFEKRPHSGYVMGRAAVVQARMSAVDLP